MQTYCPTKKAGRRVQDAQAVRAGDEARVARGEHGEERGAQGLVEPLPDRRNLARVRREFSVREVHTGPEINYVSTDDTKFSM